MDQSVVINYPHECFLCGIVLNNLHTLTAHYSSKKHQEKENQFKNTLNFATNSMPPKHNMPDHNNQSASPLTAYCYICDVTLNSKEEKDHHVQNYPHRELSGLKSRLAQDGIFDAFWVVTPDKTVFCQLCNFRVQQTDTFKAHFFSTTHLKTFNSWKMAVTGEDKSEMNRNYCKVCNKWLDGTSEAEKHYRNVLHLKQQKLLSSHMKPARKSESLPDTQSPLLFTFPTPTKDHSPFESTPTMKDRIFGEVEKLLDKLYYSKKVPANISLQLLESINRQIDDYIESNPKPNQVSDSLPISMARIESTEDLLDYQPPSSPRSVYSEPPQIKLVEKIKTKFKKSDRVVRNKEYEKPYVAELVELELSKLDDDNVEDRKVLWEFEKLITKLENPNLRQADSWKFLKEVIQQFDE